MPDHATHFRFDPTTSDIRGPIDGADQTLLQEISTNGVAFVLLFNDGRRAEIEPTGWNLLPMVATRPNAGYIACWVRLTGNSSAASEGGMPDPRNGATPVCKTSPDGQTWSNTLVLPQRRTAAWMADLRFDGDQSAFLVSIYDDPYGTFLHPWDPNDVTTYPVKNGEVGAGYPDPDAIAYR